MHLAIHPIDSLIIGAYLLGVVVLGLRIGRGQKDLQGYLLAGRDVPWWALLASIVATETSTATFLSIPGIAFAQQGDMRFLQLAMGFMLGRILVAWFFLPHYFSKNLLTAYELLQSRFGTATRQLTSTLFLIARNLGDGLRLFLAALVLEKVAQVPLVTCIVIIGAATVLYTLIGGMKAVVWNDCIQLVIYVLGAVAAGFVIVVSVPGGWQEIVTYGQANHKFDVFDFRFDLTESYTFWSGLLGGAFLSLGTHGTDQMMVQRYLSARSQSAAGLALILSGGVVFVQFALFLLLGVGLACFYHHMAPDIVFESQDAVFANFIVDYLPVGVVGITLAAVFAAAMSTLSSSLNSSAAAAVNDLYGSRKSKKADRESQQRLLLLSKFFTVVFGGLQVLIAIAASYVSESVVADALAIAGLTVGLLLGVFGLGLFTRRANQAGAMVGLAAGIISLLAVKFGTAVAWPWYSLIGAAVTFAIGYVSSVSFRRSLDS